MPCGGPLGPPGLTGAVLASPHDRVRLTASRSMSGRGGVSPSTAWERGIACHGQMACVTLAPMSTPSRPTDIHDYDAAVARARAVLDELASNRAAVFQPGRRRDALGTIQAQIARLTAGFQDFVTKLDEEIVAEEEKRKADNKADEEQRERDRPAILKLLAEADDRFKPTPTPRGATNLAEGQ